MNRFPKRLLRAFQKGKERCRNSRLKLLHFRSCKWPDRTLANLLHTCHQQPRMYALEHLTSPRVDEVNE